MLSYAQRAARGHSAAPPDGGRAADAATGDSERVGKRRAVVPGGEYPVRVAGRVTLAPNARVAVWVRPYKKGGGSAGFYVVEPGTENRPLPCLSGERRAISSYSLQLANETLTVARNTLLGYLVRAAVDEKLPPGAVPIKHFGRAAREG